MEVNDTREALNRFRYEFDEVVHKRVETIVDSLEELEQNRKFKDRHQQAQIRTMDNQFQTLVGSLGGINVKWHTFKTNSVDRAKLVAERQKDATDPTLSREMPMSSQSKEMLSVDSLASDSVKTRFNRRIVLAGEAAKLEKAKEGFEVYQLAETVRTRMKGSSQFLRGTDWERMFSEHDTDKSGRMNFQEFRIMCRAKLKLQEPDRLLRLVFESLDTAEVGELAIEDMVSFVADPAERMRTRMKLALHETGVTLNRILLDADRDKNSVLDFGEFSSMCRERLKMPDSDIHLRAVFQSIDTDKSGEITARELINWVSGR